MAANGPLVARIFQENGIVQQTVTLRFWKRRSMIDHINLHLRIMQTNLHLDLSAIRSTIAMLNAVIHYLSHGKLQGLNIGFCNQQVAKNSGHGCTNQAHLIQPAPNL